MNTLKIYYSTLCLLVLQDDHKDDVTEKDIHDIEDNHVKLKKKLVNANNKYDRLKIDLKKELNNLKDANQHELNFFNRNHKVLKVCILFKCQ